ncbi:MAG: hypothetical protein KGI33_02120 [Thaumarchaeota archaeon]|nr:hypothetical protein [Nitrososphaerota archaeon]
MGKRKKFSVSISDDVLENLRNAAAKENMPVNGLISRTLENFTLWNVRNNEFIPIRKALLARFLDMCTQEEVETLAGIVGQTSNMDTVIRLTKQFDVLNSLKAFEEWLRMSGFPYSYDEDCGIHRFIVLHDLGAKWSAYIERVVTVTLAQFGVMSRCEHTDKVLSITIDLTGSVNGSVGKGYDFSGMVAKK